MPSSRPLDGIKVVDLTRYLAGPFATQILGDYGADIIKVEPVKGAREHLNTGDKHDNYFFLSTNRSKRSLVLDYKHPRGRGVLERILASSDVLIDNFRPGVIAALGLGYENLSALNPRLIQCSISGFGSTGPLRDNPGFDQIAQGMSGLMSVTGTSETGPTRAGIAICDLLAGIFAAQGILLALEARHRTGRGQKVETSLIESMVSVLTWSAGIYFETGKSPAPHGNHHPLASPHGTFLAADRPFNIAVGNDHMWSRFVKLIGKPGLASDERFDKLGRRLKNREALNAEVNESLASHSADYWIALFNREGIPSGPILSIEEMFAHPQIAARAMLLRMDHPVLGTYSTTGLAVKLSETPGSPSRPPLLGEHTGEILAAHGYDSNEIAQLRRDGVIG